ncbi:MAG TPA: hypothetical protein PK781_02420 [Terrimesophilobacter sp.]|nr:hypothetical protein [Terrimesophilobacter sp.]
MAARSAVALAAGMIVTFVSDHSADFGLIVFGSFAAVTALVFAWAATRASVKFVVLGAVSCAVAAAGCATAAFVGEGLEVLATVLIVFASVTGAIELGLGLWLRARGAIARDAITSGILSLVFATVIVLVPLDFANAWETVTKEGDTVSGVVTADVVVVGMFGAYAIIIGVFLAIAAISAKNAVSQEPATREHALASGGH